MIDDIIKFKKILEVQLKENGKKLRDIEADSKISWPTLNKIKDWNGKDDIKIASSVLGKIQDYNKENRLVLYYKGINSEVSDEPRIRARPEAIERRIREGKLNPDRTTVMAKSFWELLGDAMAIIPDHIKVEIHISLK